jgi:hypothetical protein
VSATDGPTSPGRGIWLAWSLALLGGLAVIGAVVLALYHPCLQDGPALAREGCDGPVTPGLVVTLTVLGTLSAGIGGDGATGLARRRAPR